MEEVEEELALMMISSRHPFPAEEEAEAERRCTTFFWLLYRCSSGWRGRGGGGGGAEGGGAGPDGGVFASFSGEVFAGDFLGGGGGEEGEQMKTSAAEAKEPEAVSLIPLCFALFIPESPSAGDKFPQSQLVLHFFDFFP